MMKITKVTPIGDQGPRGQLRFEMGPSDPALRDPALQQELRDIEGKIRREDPGLRPQFGMQKAVDGGSWLTGEFATLVTVFGPVLGVTLVAWLQGRAGRKVKLKIGDTEAEARTPEEVERLLATALAHKEKQGKGAAE